MKTAKMITILLSVLAILVGCVLMFIGMVSMKFNFKELDSSNFSTKSLIAEEKFTTIAMNIKNCDVKILPSPDGTTKIDYYEAENFHVSVEIEDEKLSVIQTDSRDWYEYIGINLSEPKISVYLSETEYEALKIESLSGDIEISKGLTFSEAKIDSTSGDIDFSADAKGKIYIKTTSGDIQISKSSAESVNLLSTSGEIDISDVMYVEKISIESTSGDIEIHKVTGKDLAALSLSGEVELENVIASGHIEIMTTSGNIQLDDCDGSTLKLKSTSGDISGNLLSGKDFHPTTISGNVKIQGDSFGGRCDIQTTSGDIRFRTK